MRALALAVLALAAGAIACDKADDAPSSHAKDRGFTDPGGGFGPPTRGGIASLVPTTLTARGSTAPSLSSCGTSPSLATNSTSFSGTFTTGTSGTTCTVTFASPAYTNKPSCQLYAEGTATMPTCTISPSAITCTVTIASTAYDYTCVGH